MQNRFEFISAQENEVYKITFDGEKYIGIIYHPVTGSEVIRLIGGTEKSLRKELINWVFFQK
jgi:hypothetical protein